MNLKSLELTISGYVCIFTGLEDESGCVTNCSYAVMTSDKSHVLVVGNTQPRGDRLNLREDLGSSIKTIERRIRGLEECFNNSKPYN